MFTAVERQVDDAGQGELECIYTGFKAFAPADRDPDRDALRPEHVWPRSRMVPEIESPALCEHQQSDIHTLMPSQPDANSSRGSLRFGIVTSNRNLDHAPSIVGTNGSGQMVFQPRPSAPVM